MGVSPTTVKVMAGSNRFNRTIQELKDEAAKAATATTKSVRNLTQTSARKIVDIAAEATGAARARGPQAVGKAAEVIQQSASAAAATLARLSERAGAAAARSAAHLPGSEIVSPALPERSTEPGPTDTIAPPANNSDPLSALTVQQLRERARAEGKAGYSRLTKAELIALWD